MILSSIALFLDLPTPSKVAIYIMMFLLIFWLLVVTIRVLYSIERYFNSKVELITKKTEEMKHINYTKMTIGTMDALVLIEKLLEIEINNAMEIRMIGGTPFNILQMDQDINEISQKVYQSFRSEYFTKLSKDILVMDYWHNYIVDQCTVRMMKGYQKVNSELIARRPVNS